jgi:hypothetical protein
MEASEILTKTVRGNSPRLPQLPVWQKSKCRRTRKLVYVYTNLGH